MTPSKEKEETKTRDEAAEELYDTFMDYAEEMFRTGWIGLDNMDDDALAAEYNDHFGTNIKIVD